ncbi:hypothetical protein HO912_04635 [Streptococcus suis]|uniref:hypothetical protein n=1 Tax=Streptococcus parasuis TaxID=1501662 RepID=UPI001552D5E0|nr:hypothetical protein [Streptococcus suis]NQK66972.1 hypothetical protein [Streptococcus suis]NQP54618.1 hypothetical protein [Streptococcus suis]WNF86322.1 hypothetical protein RJW51_09655 [Streptococcus parasuis]
MNSKRKFFTTLLLSLLIFSSGFNLPQVSEKYKSKRPFRIIVVEKRAKRDTGLDVGKAD